MGALKDLYKKLVGSASKSAKSGGKSTQRKKKRESSSSSSKGSRGSGSSSRSSGSSSSGSGTRDSGSSSRSSSGSNRQSSSSNNRSSAGTRNTGSGAVSRGGTAAHRGGYTPSSRKSSSGAIKTKAQERREAAQKTSTSLSKNNAVKLTTGTAKYTAQRWAGYATKAADTASKGAITKAGTGRKGGQTTGATRSSDRGNEAQQKRAQSFAEQRAKNKEKAKALADSGYKVTRTKWNPETKKNEKVYEAYNKGTSDAYKKLTKAKENTLKETVSGFSDKKDKEIPKWVDNVWGLNKLVQSGEKQRKLEQDRLRKENPGMSEEEIRRRTKNVGKLSSQDIAKGGVEMSSEMIDYMIPYLGTSGKALKGAEKALKFMKGSKVLTQTAKGGAKELTKDGKKAVSEIAAKMVKEGKAPNDAIKAATKKVMRSDRATNIQKELLANAMQDATIGTALDAAKGKEQGLKGKEFRDYMIQNAAMNAVLGGVASGVAGRTTKAGKKALKTDIADSINKGTNLSPSEAKELVNLQYIKDSAKGNANLKGGTSASSLSKEQQTRYNDLLKKSQNTEEVVKVNDKGKIVAINKDATNVLSPTQKKEYFALKAQDKAGTITPKNKARLQELDTDVKTAQKAVDFNANEVIKYGGKKDVKVDRDTLELTVKHFENTGETAKLKKAQKLLDDDIKAATQKADDVVKALDSSGVKSDAKYRFVPDDEMRERIGEADNDNWTIYSNPKTGEREVLIRKGAANADNIILSREAVGTIKSTSKEEYKELTEALTNHSKAEGVYEEIERSLSIKHPDLKKSELRDEVTNVLLDRYVFNKDSSFIKSLANKSPEAARRLDDFISDISSNVQSPELKKQLSAITDEIENIIGEPHNLDFRITRDMSDADRAKALSSAEIKPSSISEENVIASKKELDALKTTSIQKAKKQLREIGKKFGVFDKTYYNADIDFSFKFSGKNVDESAQSQTLSSGEYEQLGKTLTSLDETVKNAVPIKEYSDLYKGTFKEGDDHEGTYVLLGAIEDNGSVSPVEMIVIRRADKRKNKLYVTVVMEKIKKMTVNAADLPTHNGRGRATMSSTYNVADLIKKVNPSDSDFLKYLPDELLTKEQLEGKRIGIEREQNKLAEMRSKTVSMVRDYRADLKRLDPNSKDALSIKSKLDRLERIISNNKELYGKDLESLLEDQSKGIGKYTDIPENPLFKEWKDLDAELKDLNKKDFTPEAEKRSDEIISRINEISEELGGGRVTKENADEALKAIEAQRASDETVVRNNEDVIKNSDDELAGIERPAPDSGEMPKGLKANRKASRPIKDRVQETLNSQKHDKKEFTKAEQKDIDKSFETISNRIANGDDAGAKADAEELVEKHFRYDAEEREIDPDYKKKREELKDIQRYLKSHAWEMPPGSARTLDEFLEYIGLPKNMTHLLPIRRWNKKASTLGKKGAHRAVIDKGGKTPRAQIDDQWSTLSKEWPEYFPPETSGVEDRFTKMVDAVMMNADDIFPEERIVRTLSDADIAEYKGFTVDEILDLARENAGTYKGIDDPTPLKPIDDMSPAQLEKHLDSEKNFHLKRAIEKHGEDSPRVKEIKDYIAKGEEKLAEMQGSKLTESEPVKPKPEKTAESKTESIKDKPIGFDEDTRDVGILPDAEVEAAKARYEAQRPNGIDAKPKRQLPTGIQKLADAKDSVVRQWVSSLYGIEKEAMKAGDKQLLNQTTKVYLTRNKLSAFIQQKRTNLDGKITGDGLDAIYEKAGLFGKKNKEKKADFTNYLLYKHAIDRLDAGKPVHMGEDGASLYTKEQYQELIDDIAGKYKERGELGQLEQFEKGMRGYYDNLMQYRVDAGLVTKDFADALKEKYPNYVPTYREGDDWMEGVISNGESYQANIGQTVGVATGGREPIEDLYSQTVKRTEDVLKNAEENVMMNMFAKAKGLGPGAIPRGATLEEVSEAAISVHKGHDGGWRVTFFQDGEPVTMACDKIVAQGLKEFNGTDFSTMMNAFTKMSSNKVTNTIGTNFKHLITDWNIMFGIRNGARDFQQALVNSKNTRAYCKSIPQAYASIARSITGQESAYMKLYQANGGRYSALVRQDKKFVEPGMEKIPKGLKAPIRALEAANSAIEMGPRMCEFIGTLNKHANDILKKDGSSVKQLRKEMMEDMYPGKTAKQLTADEIDEFEEKVANRIVDLCGKDAVDEAMRNSADITLNFSRTGVMGKTLNSGLVPYLNPSLQGLSKTIRLFTEGRADKALLNLGMKLGTFTIAPAVLNEVLMKDNRDYQNLNTREKDSNFFISIGDGKFIKVPKPRENAVLAEPVEYGLRYFFDKAQVGVIDKGEYSGEKMFQMWDSAWDNIGPVNPLTDNIISPLVRLWQNKTWYGGSIDSISDTIALRDGETKHSEVFDEKTSALAIEIGNKKFGGKTISDRFKLSPKKIDDLMDSYLGMIYDLGVLSLDKTKPEVGSGNPFVNQFVKDSVFSNKTGTELWEEFAKLNAPKTTGGKILQAGKDAVLGNNKYNITDKTIEAQDWLNQKGYDDMTYSSAVLHFQTSKDFKGKKKEDLIRNAKIAQNTFRHDLAYGDGIVTPKMDPIRKLAGMVGVDYAMEKLTYTYVDPETGEKKNQHLDAWRAYKKSDEYKNNPKTADGKFIDFYSKMRWTNGLIGENKSYPSWMTASVLAATEKGKNDDLAKAYIRPDFDEDGEYTKKIIQRGKNYRDYGFTQGYYRKSQRTLFKAGRALEYEYTNKMNPWDKAMALSTAKKNYADGAYYSADTDGKVSRRMNYARYLNKTDHTTKEIYDFADKYNLELPKFDYENTTAKERGEGWRAFNKKVEAAVNKEYKDATDAVKAAVYHVITDDTYNKPFGDIPDMTQKNDTGITKLDELENKGRGRGRRGRRRGRRGGGGGGSGGGGEVPATATGAIKAKATKTAGPKASRLGKITDPFGQISDVTVKSNLDNAYRKRLKKLREKSRKH